MLVKNKIEIETSSYALRFIGNLKEFLELFKI